MKAFGKLMQHTGLSVTEILPFSFRPGAVLYQLDYNNEKAKNHGLSILGRPENSHGVHSRKMAGSGLNMRHLQAIFRREREDGLENTFMNKNTDGKSRVKCTKNVLHKTIANFVTELDSQTTVRVQSNFGHSNFKGP